MEKDFSFLNYLKTINAEDQVYNDLDPSHLWLFHISDTDVKGPFIQDDIIKLIPRFRHEFAPLNVCSLDEKELRPFFDHPCFNGRDHTREIHPKTKFRKTELIADNYHCFVNGVKKGPFVLEEVKEMIHAQEIKADALISADNGMTWHRAYSYPQFNRRKRSTLSEHQLTMPEDAIQKTKILVLEKIKKSEDSQDSGAMSAALLSGKNKFLDKERIQGIISDKIAKVGLKSKGNGTSAKKTNPLFAVALVIAIVLLVFVDVDVKKDKKYDPLESLQGGTKKGSTTSRYEDSSPPRPIGGDKNLEEETSYKPNSFKGSADEEYSSSDEEDFDQEPQEFNEGTKASSKRDLSSTKKKSPKKFTVSHQEEEPIDEETVDPEAEEEDVDDEGFEITE
jgi:hypothetical protein